MSDVRRGYDQNKRAQDKNDIWLFFVARPISLILTELFLKARISANQTTYISMCVGLAGCGLLAFGSYGVRIVGVLLVCLWIVLDCVDGNIARVKQTQSHYGEFIDALSGYLMNSLVFLSVGIAAYSEPGALLEFVAPIVVDDPYILIIIGAWASLAIILPRLVYHKFMNTFPEAARAEFKSEAKLSAGLYHFGYHIVHNITSFAGFLTPILLLATIFRLLGVFALFYAVVNTGVFIVTTGRMVIKGNYLS